MKNLKVLIVTAVVALLPCGAMAQQNFLKAIDEFVNGSQRENIQPTITTHNDPNKNNQPLDFTYEYKFKINKSADKQLEKVRTAFYKDLGCAYSSLVKLADSKSEQTLLISYGENLQYEMSFGEHANHNYLVMLVKEPSDTTRRYVYATVWYNSGKKIEGEIFKIYSLDPKVTKVHSNVTYFHWPFVSGGANPAIKNDSIITINKDGTETIMPSKSGQIVTIINTGKEAKVSCSDGTNYYITNDDRLTIKVNGKYVYVFSKDNKTIVYCNGRCYELGAKNGYVTIDKDNRVGVNGDKITVYKYPNLFYRDNMHSNAKALYERIYEAQKRAEEAGLKAEEARKRVEEASKHVEEASKHVAETTPPHVEEAQKQVEEAQKEVEEAQQRIEEATNEKQQKIEEEENRIEEATKEKEQKIEEALQREMEAQKRTKKYSGKTSNADNEMTDKIEKQYRLFDKYVLTSSEESQKEIWSDIANKVVDICQDYKNRISNDTKTTVKYRIIDMRGMASEQKQNDVVKILDKAINYLK
jgi:hypothetical protein